MNRRFFTLQGSALILIGLTLPASPLTAQTGTYYPYWDTAPSSFRPSGNIYVPSMLSPGFYSQSAFGSLASGLNSSPFLSTSTSALDLMLARPGNLHLPRSDNKAYIWLSVPAEAQVWFDEGKTKQTGEIRHFYTTPLTPGKEYVYALRVRWMKDGKPFERSRQIVVRAKDRIHLDFLDHDAEKPAETTPEKKNASSETSK